MAAAISGYSGRGGTILPREVEELHELHHADLFTDRWKENGIGRDDRRPDQALRFSTERQSRAFKASRAGRMEDIRKIARAISNAENAPGGPAAGQKVKGGEKRSPAWHHGYGGAGKSSVTDEIVSAT